MDIRLSSSGGFLDAIRRLEYIALLAVSALGVLFFQPYSLVLAGPLVLLALMLVPGRVDPAVTREKQRLDTLNDLQNQGLSLRSRWVEICAQPLTAENALERWEIRRNAVAWISRCHDDLGQYPEIGGIFDAHDHGNDIIEELDACLIILSRIRRLVSLSQSLKLPI